CVLRSFPPRRSSDLLRALMARIPDENDLTAALHLMAAPAVFTTAILRERKGRRPIRPDPTLPHSADILRMMNAGMPDEVEVAGRSEEHTSELQSREN